jgi:predicted alpha-1,2-mannosidase
MGQMRIRGLIRKVVPAGAAVLAAVVVLTQGLPSSSSSTGDTSTRTVVTRDPAALVDPFVGTGSNGAAEGKINTFPGASLPFGMMQWSPDTTSRPVGGGYSYTDSRITGFSLTHVSGPGCAIGGAIPVLPVAGALPRGLTTASEPYRHSAETAHPGSYAVTAGGVRTQLAVTERAGVARFTYPARSTARLLVKVAKSDSRSGGATFQRSGDQEISGSVTTGDFCVSGPDQYTLYFAARFSRPFTSARTWRLANGQLAGAALDFGSTSAGRSVGMRVAVSYVSAAGARANLAAEMRTWSVPSVAAQATRVWNRQLGAIGVAGGSRTAQATFYTALYHSSLEPSLASDTGGWYRGFDGQDHTAPPGHAQYADFSSWDIYRSEVPLLATIDPGEAADMATSLLNDAAQGGSLPRWPVENADTGIMNGDSADPVLADCYAFGARGFNAKAALSAMIAGADGTSRTGPGSWYTERPNAAAYLAEGYVPNIAPDSGSPVPDGASETLEYSVDDFAVSRLAQALGDRTATAVFAGRGQNWSHLFDAGRGYIEPRDAAGAFPSGPPVQVEPGNGQDGFEEGNAAQYTWMVPQNLAGLIQKMGGDAAVTARLDEFFTRLNAGPDLPYAWQGDEAGLGTPWIYDSAGQPWKTQALVQRITSHLYGLTPGGEPGQDDLGALGSWYVWAALGLYPQTPGVAMLVLGTPQFSRAVIHGAYGPLTVTASGAGKYVHGLTVNGQPSQHTYVDLAGTRQLAFARSSTPDKRWGTSPGDAPPSFGSPLRGRRAAGHRHHVAGGEAPAVRVVGNGPGHQPGEAGDVVSVLAVALLGGGEGDAQRTGREVVAVAAGDPEVVDRSRPGVRRPGTVQGHVERDAVHRAVQVSLGAGMRQAVGGHGPAVGPLRPVLLPERVAAGGLGVVGGSGPVEDGVRQRRHRRRDGAGQDRRRRRGAAGAADPDDTELVGRSGQQPGRRVAGLAPGHGGDLLAVLHDRVRGRLRALGRPLQRH